MLTIDLRCHDRDCRRKGIYRMVGDCRNCGAEPVLMLFTAAHEAHVGRCPCCECETVYPKRSATPDEVPGA